MKDFNNFRIIYAKALYNSILWAIINPLRYK